MKHLNIVTKDMNINASDEEDLKLVPCTFFLITDNEASEHSDERPEDESYNVLPFPCTCSVTSLVVLLPSPAKHLVMIEMGGR